MMMPSIFGENLFDDFMDFPFDDKWEKRMNKEFFGRKNPLYGKNAARLMKTDVCETDSAYELDVDLPGFKKDEIQVELEDGYLTISAEKGLDKEEEKKGKYIRRERYAGACSRTFYVGENVERGYQGEFQTWYPEAFSSQDRREKGCGRPQLYFH